MIFITPHVPGCVWDYLLFMFLQTNGMRLELLQIRWILLSWFGLKDLGMSPSGGSILDGSPPF